MAESYSPRARPPSKGFSLIEALISLFITLVVVALVYQTSRTLLTIYRTESRAVELSSMASRALDDITVEIARAGYGMGEGVASVAPSMHDRPLSSSEIVLRSNTEGVTSALTVEAPADTNQLTLNEAGRFEPGNLVLLTDLAGLTERARVTSTGASSLWLESLDNPSGALRNTYSPQQGSRVLKLREVHYHLESEPDGKVLVKNIDGSPEVSRVLTRQVEALRFEYLDDAGAVLSPASPELTDRLRTVRVLLTFFTGSERGDRKTFKTAVTLDRQSASVDFAERGYGFRLARFFHPLENPAGLSTRLARDWGVIVSGGADPSGDRSYVYTFLIQEKFLEARTENVTWLEEVREPVALAFAPEKSALSGSLLIASSGLRVGHLTRVHPDEHGILSPASKVETFDTTNVLAQIGGIAFGVDHALYIASSEKAKIFRIRFDSSDNQTAPEAIAELPGSPGAIVQGADGGLYFILDETDGSSLWTIPFDETFAPTLPREVAELPGRGISLTLEPHSGNLFVLLRERSRDNSIYELTRRWIREPTGEPEKIFSLRRFRSQQQDGVDENKTSSTNNETIVRPAHLPTTLLPESLDFIAFDHLGLLYIGAKDRSLVLKFDLDRPDARYHVEVTGIVDLPRDPTSTSPRIRLHAWTRNPLGW